MMRITLAFATLLCMCASLNAQQASPHAREAVQTIRELRAIGIPNSEDMQTGPPPAVPKLLRQLNHQLRALIIETLNDKNQHTIVSEEEIFSKLRKAGWEEIPDHKWNAYGEIVQIRLNWELGYDPGILVVTTQLWVPCGSSDPDSAIYVFQGRAREWKLVLATDADFASSDDSQRSGMDFKISPPDSNGKWFLAVAHTPPTCRHAPLRVSYKVLRPGRTADEPIRLLNASQPVDSTFVPPFKLRVESDWTALTRGKERKLDGEPGVSIARYEVGSENVRRLPPLATTLDDFVEEWTQSNWEEASHWSNESAKQDLERWHSKLAGLTFDSTEFQSITQCPVKEGSDSKWLIDLWIDLKQNPSIEEENIYIVASVQNGIYYVQAISATRPAGCPGSQPLPRRSIPDTLPSW